jgi:hypothetical protein
MLVKEGEDKLRSLLNGRDVEVRSENESLCFSLPGQEVGEFLYVAGRSGVRYSDISIDHPTLEEYFLSISKEAT